jgi:hypothetical protein
MKDRNSLILIPLLCVIPALPVRAQNASVRGVVTDQSGAFVPGVTVRVTNNATGVSQTVQTNEQGFYLATSLIPGVYNLGVSKTGFTTITQENLVLGVEQAARADFSLQVGGVAQTVEVSAATALIDSETTTVGQVISNRSIVELPLNGRNYLQLARLTAAVTTARGTRGENQGVFSAVGQHGTQTSYSLDGVDNKSRMTGGPVGTEAQIVTPSIDSIAEFKVVTNNISAEYGFRTGGTVIISTKGGTNQYHGVLYEFLRNSKLDATNFFSVGRPKPPYRQNEFGGTFGGPIIRNRTFFFGSYEGTRIRDGRSNLVTLPTTAYKSGDFSVGARPLYDWKTTRPLGSGYTRDPFPGNLIPAGRFDPVAKNVIDLYPDPNLPGTVSNFYSSPTAQNDTDQIDLRADHNFTQNERAFWRYSRRKNYQLSPPVMPLPADGGGNSLDVAGHALVMNLNSTLTASSNNEFRFGFSRLIPFNDILWTENYNTKVGIKGVPDLGDPTNRGMTRFAVSGFQQIGPGSFLPNRGGLDIVHINDNFLIIRGRHAMKLGFEFRREDLFRGASRFARGFFNFDGSFSQDPSRRGQTGNGVADFLLGTANTGTLGNPNGETAVTHNYGIYFQDDWRIASKLTLNLGVRWEMFGPPSFKNQDEFPVSNFLFKYGSPDYQIVKPKNEGDCGCDRDLNNFGPRVGLAYQLTPRTVIRSGFGVLYGAPDAIAFFGDARFQHMPPEFTEVTFPTDALTNPALIVSNGFPPGLIPAAKVLENTLVNTADRFMPSMYSMQWFFDAQRELPGQMVLTLSYIGNGGRHLVQMRDLNQPLTPGPGSVKSRSPWPYFAFVIYRDPLGNSSYNATTVKLEKRYSQGLQLMTAYTYSHAIDNTAEALTNAGGQELQDNYDVKRNRGNSAFDRRSMFVTSAVYDLPFGKGKKWLNHSGPLDWILGGWQAGGILNLLSGQPFSALVSVDISNTGTGNPTGGTSNRNHPDRIGNGNLPGDKRTISRWFDLSAFAIPAQYTYGNSGRNVLYGPPFNNLDLKIGKNFYFWEGKRLEFRCEMFNSSNTPHFNLPAANVNLPTAGIITGAAAPRQIQFGLKLVF